MEAAATEWPGCPLQGALHSKGVARHSQLCRCGTRGHTVCRGGVRLNLRLFFRWTGAFIIFGTAGLLASGLRALHEAGAWNGLQATVFDLQRHPAR